MKQLSSFSSRVYEIVKCVPPGMVATYGQIAFTLGAPHGARIVGFALRACRSDDVPCHRVIFSDGALCAHWPEQRTLLEQEGVVFMPDVRVNMQLCRWPGLS